MSMLPDDDIVLPKLPSECLEANLLEPYWNGGWMLNATHYSEQPVQEALEKLGEYFRREVGTSEPPFVSALEPRDAESYCFMGAHSKEAKLTVIGACTFRMVKCYNDFDDPEASETPGDSEDDEWSLDWIWLHPDERRKGILLSVWPFFRSQYRKFSVREPYTPAMAAFLAKHSPDTKPTPPTIPLRQTVHANPLLHFVRQNNVPEARSFLSSIATKEPVPVMVANAYSAVLDNPTSINVEMLRLFLEWGIDPNAEYMSWEGPTYPVLTATFKGDVEALRMLLNSGASVKGEIGIDALFNTLNGYSHGKQRWLETQLTDDEWNPMPRPPLMEGAFMINKQGQLVQEYVRDSVDTATIAAWIESGRESLLLLVPLLDLNARSDTYSLPLHAAAAWGWPETVRTFLNAGADAHTPDDKGQTPLLIAQKMRAEAESRSEYYRLPYFDETINILANIHPNTG